MGFIVLPISLVDVTVGVDEPSPSIGLVIDPIAFVEGEILPYLFASSISHAILKLADVDGVVFEFDGSLGNVLSFFIIIIFKRP